MESRFLADIIRQTAQLTRTGVGFLKLGTFGQETYHFTRIVEKVNIPLFVREGCGQVLYFLEFKSNYLLLLFACSHLSLFFLWFL
jgi:hypothetical protein